MKLWTTAEVMADVGEALHPVRNSIEDSINQFLKKIIIPEDVEKWVVVFLIFPKTLEPSFPEVVRILAKRKVWEFRLHISHADFLSASEFRQREMIFDCLRRSIDLMAELKVSKKTQATLHSILVKSRKILATAIGESGKSIS